MSTDIHKVTAAEIFGVSSDEVTPEQRRAARAINFPVMYKTGLHKVFEDEVALAADAEAEGQFSAAIADLLGCSTDDVDWDRPSAKFWRCQECGHEDRVKPMPTDRTKFYARVAERGSPKCPECKSVGFMPVGF